MMVHQVIMLVLMLIKLLTALLMFMRYLTVLMQYQEGQKLQPLRGLYAYLVLAHMLLGVVSDGA